MIVPFLSSFSSIYLVLVENISGSLGLGLSVPYCGVFIIYLVASRGGFDITNSVIGLWNLLSRSTSVIYKSVIKESAFIEFTKNGNF